MNKDIKIYVVTHKPFNNDFLKSLNIYKTIKVGNNKNLVCDFSDDKNDNIAEKNSNFCELTALYWIWKNTNSDIIGICHYRRYFTNYNLKLMKKNEIEKLLKKYDCILPFRTRTHKKNVYEKYGEVHYKSDLDKCKKIIETNFPEYVPYFNEAMEKNYFYPFNMLITTKEKYNEYCEWLFKILFELEKIVDISNRDNYQKRIFGFISERLLYVWVLKNNSSFIEMPVINVEASIKEKIKLRLRVMFNRFLK